MTHNRKRNFQFGLSAAAVAATVLLAFAAPAQSQDLTIKTVALEDDPAPDTDPGVVFKSFSTPSLNITGHMAFRATLEGPGLTTEEKIGIFKGRAGTLGLIAQGGDDAPGTGLKFTDLNSLLVLNGVGDVAFRGFLTGTGQFATIDGIFRWTENAQSLELIAWDGQLMAPGTAVQFLDFFPPPLLNGSGHTALESTLTVPGGRGVWKNIGNELEFVALPGGIPPGADAPGVTFGNLSRVVLNGAGDTAFFGTLVGTPNNSGFWKESQVGLEFVAIEGQAATGFETPDLNDIDPVFNDFGIGPPGLNDAGHTAIWGRVTGTGIVFNVNNTGIWSGNPLTIVVRAGDAPPGVPQPPGHNPNDPPVVVFRTFGGTNPVVNGGGDTAFVGTLKTGGGTGITLNDDTGIWKTSGGTLDLLARENQQAPGTAPGVVFNSFGTPSLNGAGNTVFTATLKQDPSTGVNSTNDFGIWAEDPSGVLTLIAREGDLLTVGPGDDRTILGFFFNFPRSGNEDGRPSAFNDNGEVAFVAFFTDGSQGVFLATFNGADEDGDGDDDGIANDVDTKPDVFSNGFSDGNTSGTIALRGDREWSVEDAPGIDTGVRITVGPGVQAAQIQGGSLCIFSTVVDIPSAGSIFDLTCGSSTVQVADGADGPVNATVTVNGLIASVTVPPGGGVTFNLIGGTLFIDNIGATSLSGQFDGVPFSLGPGESFNHPPAANAGQDQTLECASPAGTQVNLDGSGSSDPDSDPLTFEWTGPFGTVTGSTPTVSLPLGVNLIDLKVTDSGGLMDMDMVTITVEDTTPPVIADVPAPIEVEQTSQEGASADVPLPTANDACSSPVTVTSDAPAVFQLGTTTVTFTATDGAGNTATASTSVTVVESATPGKMHGRGRIKEDDKRHHFFFFVKERGDGTEKGFLWYQVRENSHHSYGWKHAYYRWRKDRHQRVNRFVSKDITGVFFSVESNNSTSKPEHGYKHWRRHRRQPTVTTVAFSGVGRWNGTPGFTFEAHATDAGRKWGDTFSITIKDPSGSTLATMIGKLSSGSIQSSEIKD